MMAFDPSVEQKQMVFFAPDDKEDPRNWSDARKVWTVGLLCIMSFCGVFGSSSYAPGETQLQRVYGINADLSSTGLTLYLLGFAIGPLICPLSEMYGRKISYTISWPLMIIFIAPSAFVPNIAAILVFRFFSGLCAACPLNNGGGVCSDLYNNDLHRLGKAILFYTFSPLSGPVFGTLVGFFVAAHSSGSALWVVRVHFFFSIAVIPCVFLLPETHGPTILKRRARALRKQGQNAWAAHELKVFTKQQIIHDHLIRPMSMLFREPIVQGAAVWISLAYGIVYFFFEAFPVVFIEQHKIPFQLCGLTFLGIPIGMSIVLLFSDPLQVFFQRLPLPGIEREDAVKGGLESRLKFALSACLLMPVSLFWFAWASGPETHWIAAVLAGIPFGYSMFLIFWAFNAYASQTYTIYSSSSLAANTCIRSLAASFLPVAAHSLLRNLGTKWGVSLFGFLSIGLIPIPLIFIRYGASLRKRSHFAAEAQAIITGMKEKEPSMETQVEDEVTQPEESSFREGVRDEEKAMAN